MPSNLALSARLAADTASVPGWLIAQQQEANAEEFLGTKFLDKPRCPSCFLVLPVAGECDCK